MQDPDPEETERASCIHSATLMGGAELALLEDPTHSLPITKDIINTPLKNNKHYRRGIYDAPECLLKLKDLGNLTNGRDTVTTILEVWRSTESVEIAFKQKSDFNCWPTRTEMGEPVYKATTSTIRNHKSKIII